MAGREPDRAAEDDELGRCERAIERDDGPRPTAVRGPRERARSARRRSAGRVRQRSIHAAVGATGAGAASTSALGMTSSIVHGVPANRASSVNGLAAIRRAGMRSTFEVRPDFAGDPQILDGRGDDQRPHRVLGLVQRPRRRAARPDRRAAAARARARTRSHARTSIVATAHAQLAARRERIAEHAADHAQRRGTADQLFDAATAWRDREPARDRIARRERSRPCGSCSNGNVPIFHSPRNFRKLGLVHKGWYAFVLHLPTRGQPHA